MNLKRILLGGLLAGLVNNFLGITFAHFVLQDELRAVMARLGITSFPAYTPFLHLGTRFAAGMALMWLCAALRPCFGPGPRTALIAGLGAWFFWYAVFALGMASWPLFSHRALLLIAPGAWSKSRSPAWRVPGSTARTEHNFLLDKYVCR